MPLPYSDKNFSLANEFGDYWVVDWSRQEYEEVIKSKYLHFNEDRQLSLKFETQGEVESPTKWNGEPGRVYFDVFQKQILQKMTRKELQSFIDNNM